MNRRQMLQSTAGGAIATTALSHVATAAAPDLKPVDGAEDRSQSARIALVHPWRPAQPIASLVTQLETLLPATGVSPGVACSVSLGGDDDWSGEPLREGFETATEALAWYDAPSGQDWRDTARRTHGLEVMPIAFVPVSRPLWLFNDQGPQSLPNAWVETSKCLGSFLTGRLGTYLEPSHARGGCLERDAEHSVAARVGDLVADDLPDVLAARRSPRGRVAPSGVILSGVLPSVTPVWAAFSSDGWSRLDASTHRVIRKALATVGERLVHDTVLHDRMARHVLARRGLSVFG